MSEDVDVAVVAGKSQAEAIMKALKKGGIHHIGFWPEHMLDFYGGKAIGLAYPDDQHLGPFHVRVREEDLPAAKLVLSSAGLVPPE